MGEDGQVTHAAQDWYAEFARPVFRTRIPEMIDEATPELTRRLSESPTAYLDLIAVLDVAAQEADQLLREAVLTARHSGLNWEQIGQSLGIDRQQAQLRFAPPAAPSTDLESPRGRSPELKTTTVTPPTISQAIGAVIVDALATARSKESPAQFQVGTRRRIDVVWGEKAVMRRYGPYGWHLVEYNAETHTLELDDQQWEHQRTNFGRRPDGPGWRSIGDGWGWYSYWKRPTGLPVLPGNPHPREFE